MTTADMATYGAVREDVYPGYRTAIVFQEPDGRLVRSMFWGFIPPWVKDEDLHKFMKPNNARDDTIIKNLHERKGMFYSSMKSGKRCIIDVSGWCEWTGDKGEKIANRLTVKGHEHISIAGLYTYREGFPGFSCTMITTEAKGRVSEFHHRVPVVLLSVNDEDAWLDPNSDPFELTRLFQSIPDDLLIVEQRPEDQRNRQDRSLDDMNLFD